MFKYADDTTLLVPEHSDIGIDIEFNHVKAWAAINGLTLNLNKTKEIVFSLTSRWTPMSSTYFLSVLSAYI